MSKQRQKGDAHADLRYAFDQWAEANYPGSLSVREYTYTPPKREITGGWLRRLWDGLNSAYDWIPPAATADKIEDHEGFDLTDRDLGRGVVASHVWFPVLAPRTEHDFSLAPSIHDISPDGVVTLEGTLLRPAVPGRIYSRPQVERIYIPGNPAEYPIEVRFENLNPTQAIRVHTALIPYLPH